MICNFRYTLALNIFSIIVATKVSRYLGYNDLISAEELIAPKRKLGKFNPISVGRMVIDLKFLLYYVLCYVSVSFKPKK